MAIYQDGPALNMGDHCDREQAEEEKKADNVISWCPDPVIVDTVYVYETDTLYITDTLYVDNYIYDTTYVEVTDTIFVDNFSIKCFKWVKRR